MFTQRKAHSKEFWEHSFTSEERNSRQLFFPPHLVANVCQHSEQLTFAGHHGARLKPILARTLEPSDHVGAVSVSTRVSDGALVGV